MKKFRPVILLTLMICLSHFGFASGAWDELRQMLNDAHTWTGAQIFKQLFIQDTNQSHETEIKWNENDTNDRTLNVAVNGGNRTLSLTGDLTGNQNVSTTGTPQFSRLGIGAAADASIPLLVSGKASVTGNLLINSPTENGNLAGGIIIKNGTAASANVTDGVQIWSADRGGTAGKAGLYIRSEDGTSHVISDYVGIGTVSPVTNLHVWTGNAGTDPAWIAGTDQLIIEDEVASIIQLFAPSLGGIQFSDNVRNQGGILYDHSTDYMMFTVSAVEKFRIDTNGNIGVSQTTFGTSAVKVFAISSGTPPTTSPANAIQAYSVDQNGTAGKAALHIRDEAGETYNLGNGIGLKRTTGGLQRRLAEATANITADASVTITLSVPSGARLLGAQLRVDTALAVGETWDAAYSGGSTTAIATNQAVAQNTKVNTMYNTNGASDITANTTNIAITKNGGGAFTAQGTIRAIVYYEDFDAMASM